MRQEAGARRGSGGGGRAIADGHVARGDPGSCGFSRVPGLGAEKVPVIGQRRSGLLPNPQLTAPRRCDPPGGRTLGARFLTLVVAIVALGLALTSCYPGVYAADVFPEMHYQEYRRPYEPETLAAPAGAVPVTGRVALPANIEAAARLANPYARDQQAAQRGERLFRVNCVACHGQTGKGDSLMADYFEKANLTPPADLTGPIVGALTEGQVFFVLTNGSGEMPPFGKLLTPDERWYLVSYLRRGS